tara:strand:+ start:2463 stop:4322 length:1860 start_codon:yes stop_codon:yes gene_type:complete
MIKNINSILKNYFLYFIIFDIILSIFSTYLAYSLRIETYHIPSLINLSTYLICATSFIPIFIYFNIYEISIKYSSLDTIKKIILAVLIYSILLFVIFSLLKNGTPRSLSVIQPLIFFPIICISRILILLQNRANINQDIPNLVIYGAGSAGTQLLNSIQSNNLYNVVAFIDDDVSKNGKQISNVKIYEESMMQTLIADFSVKNIVIAMPSMKITYRRKLVKKLSKYKIETKILPDISDLINHDISINDLRSVNIDDLIDREIDTSNQNITVLKNKNVLVTGAGGSIGSELCKQIIFQEPKEIILLDHSEYNLYRVQEDLEKIATFEGNNIKCKIIPILLSINNFKRLELLFKEKNPKIIFHAAAYKHVNLVEINIFESIRNNYFGTLNIARLSKKYKVENLLLISSDKAVRPTNIMGATKRLSELVIQAYANEEKNSSKSKIFSIVRFGNVLASSGSVINKFNNQIKNREPLTLTHPEVTRYFMTIYEAVHLILQTIMISKGGEVFLLDMGKPIKVIDLAKKMINLSGLKLKDELNIDGDIEIKIIGLRQGEKLFEELLINNKSIPSTNKNIFYANENYITVDKLNTISEKLELSIEKNDLASAIFTLEEHVSGFKYKI